MITLVIGASTNPERYSFKAITSLRLHKKDVVALGLKAGKVADVDFVTSTSDIAATIDTVTLYINPKLQEPYQQFILDLKPRRVIFNPGTENPVFADLLAQADIKPIEACTLVMLSIGTY
jgi:uncharacterized protein